MLDQGCYGFDVDVIIEGLESSVVVGYYRVRHSKLVDDTSPYEIFHVFGKDGHEWFGLDPFGKIVDSDQEDFCLSFSYGEGTDNVHPQMANDHGDVVLCITSGLRWCKGPNS